MKTGGKVTYKVPKYQRRWISRSCDKTDIEKKNSLDDSIDVPVQKTKKPKPRVSIKISSMKKLTKVNTSKKRKVCIKIKK